jgi:hypothetical protein
MNKTTLYARYERTQDPVAYKHLPLEGQARYRSMQDVAIYRDPECRSLRARVTPFECRRVTRNSKSFTLNCMNYALSWVDDQTPSLAELRAARLEELRTELRAERISYDGLVELQSLARFIDPGDVELLEAAGVPE